MQWGNDPRSMVNEVGVINSFDETVLILITTVVGLTVVAWFGLPVMVRYAQNRRIQVLCKREKLIALTFDDGPCPGITEKVLDMLEELDVKATFFMIGRLARENEGLLRHVEAKGHLIASHTEDHLDAWRVGPIRGIRDLRNGIRTLKDRELSVSWFRPPRGKATFGTLLSCWFQGCRMIWWTHVSGDTGHGIGKVRLGPAQIMRKLASRKKTPLTPEENRSPHKREDLLRSLEQKGGVVLLHDGERTQEGYKALTMECTRDIVKRAKKSGFRFVTLEELK